MPTRSVVEGLNVVRNIFRCQHAILVDVFLDALFFQTTEKGFRYRIIPTAAFSAHAGHPVEVDSAHAEHLVAWLSKRLGTPLKAPDFRAQGFELLGGRLLAGATGPVPQFMYQDKLERRVTLYVRKDAASHRDTAFRHASENGVEVFYWIDNDFGYALSGQIGKASIGALADSAYRQMASLPTR
jgi:anti-sigma factor RsiW